MMCRYAALLLLSFCLAGCGQESSPSYQARTTSFPTQTPESPQRPEQQESGRLAIVRRSRYRPRKIMSQSERDLFWKLIRLEGQGKYFRVYPQVSMGAILATDDSKEVFDAVQYLRPDFVITDKNFKAIGIVEYNGGEHRDDTDARKMAAMEQSGMFYHGVTESDLKNNIDKHLKEKLLPKIKKNTG